MGSIVSMNFLCIDFTIVGDLGPKNQVLLGNMSCTVPCSVRDSWFLDHQKSTIDWQVESHTIINQPSCISYINSISTIYSLISPYKFHMLIYNSINELYVHIFSLIHIILTVYSLISPYAHGSFIPLNSYHQPTEVCETNCSTLPSERVMVG